MNKNADSNSGFGTASLRTRFNHGRLPCCVLNTTKENFTEAKTRKVVDGLSLFIAVQCAPCWFEKPKWLRSTIIETWKQIGRSALQPPTHWQVVYRHQLQFRGMQKTKAREHFHCWNYTAI